MAAASFKENKMKDYFKDYISDCSLVILAVYAILAANSRPAKELVDEMTGISRRDTTPITLVKKEQIMQAPFFALTPRANGFFFFDADGNPETIEYVGRMEQNRPDDIATFENLKIGTKKPAGDFRFNMFLHEVRVRQ